MKGRISELDKTFTEPVSIAGRIDAELNPVSIPSFNTSLTFTPDVTGLAEAVKEAVKEALETSDKDTGSKTPEKADKPLGGTSPGEGETSKPGQTAIADVARFEERRQKIFGSGNETVQTSITQDEFTRALVEGNQSSLERSGLFDLPRTIAEGIGKLGSFILGSGLIGVGAGDVGAASEAAKVNADVSASLKAEGSPRSDFVVTLSPNVFTNQGTTNPDDTGR